MLYNVKLEAKKLLFMPKKDLGFTFHTVWKLDKILKYKSFC